MRHKPQATSHEGVVFKISDFSRLTRVSVKMLRHYDEIGLLSPTHTDPETGYRFYSIGQLPRLHRLIALKDLGFSLEQVATLLDAELSTTTLQSMLKQREVDLAARIRSEQQRLSQVRYHLNQITQDSRPPAYDVVLRQVDPCPAAMIRRIVPELDDAVTNLFDQIEEYVAEHRARAAAGPALIYHDREYRETDADVEVAIPINIPIPSSGDVRIGELPGGLMACVVYTGDYEQLGVALSALLRWADSSGYTVAGPLREVYLQFRATRGRELGLPRAFLTRHTDEFVTEIQLPVAEVHTAISNP